MKGIAKGKINPEYKESNTNSQGGFSAEIKTADRENAEKIIAGDKQTRVIRTDDMKTEQSDGKGNTIRKSNDQLYDIAEVDQHGKYKVGSGRQLKYIKETPKTCAEELLNKKHDKYRDADVPIEVPSDFYDGVKQELAAKAEKIKKQIEAAEKKGDVNLVTKKKAELDKVEKTSRNLRKGKLTKDEAIEAREHPKLSTAKDIARLSHRAGVKAAKSGAAIGGGLSFIRNAVAVIKEDRTPQEAALELTKDTAKAGAFSYATAAIGAALKGAMQNASAQHVRSLSKSNLPGHVVNVILETGKALTRYATGETDGTECLIELGEKGTSLLASSMGATLGAGALSFAKGVTIGSVAIPIPIVGGLIGGMIGYSLASSYYNVLMPCKKQRWPMRSGYSSRRSAVQLLSQSKNIA